MEQKAWMTAEDKKTAEHFKSIKNMFAGRIKQGGAAKLCSVTKANVVSLYAQNADEMDNDLPVHNKHGVSSEVQVMLTQIKSAKDEASKMVGHSHKEIDDDREELQHLEEQYYNKGKNLKDRENVGKRLQAYNNGVRVRRDECLNLVREKEREVEADKKKLSQFDSKLRSFFGDKSDEKRYRNLCRQLEERNRAYACMEKECGIVVRQLDKNKVLYDEIAFQLNEYEKRLLNMSEKVAYWLEWYVLYDIFCTYLNAQGNLVELDMILADCGEQTIVFDSYADVKEALEYWKDRDKHPEYLKNKIESLKLKYQSA